MASYVLQGVFAGSDDMAEVHDNSDAGACQSLRQQFRELQIPAEA